MKPCKNFDVCNNYIGNTAKMCERCEADARELDGQPPKNWRATGWDRSDNRKDAQNGHKGKKGK